MTMADVKKANSKAIAEFELCSILHKEYGEAMKKLSEARKKKAPQDEIQKLQADAKRRLDLLSTESGKFDNAISEMDKALQKIPQNGPDANAAKEMQDELKSHRNIAQVFRRARAEEFFKKKYP